MKEIFNNFIKNISGSLKVGQDGYSARKITALMVMLMVLAGHIAWLKSAFMHNDFSLLISVFTTDYLFVAGLLGMTTYQTIKQNGNSNDKTPEPTNS